MLTLQNLHNVSGKTRHMQQRHQRYTCRNNQKMVRHAHTTKPAQRLWQDPTHAAKASKVHVQKQPKNGPSCSHYKTCTTSLARPDTCSKGIKGTRAETTKKWSVMLRLQNLHNVSGKTRHMQQ